MARPDAAQARRHYADQAAIAGRAGATLGRLVADRSAWADILPRLAAYQLAAATGAVQAMADVDGTNPRVNPQVFAGVSSAGFPVSEPLVAAIDYAVPAPVETLPAPWWPGTEREQVQAVAERVIQGLVKDAGRGAFQAELVASHHDRYVRVLTPPSCQRCAVLAGRIYKSRDPFNRHPTCDCQHWPADSWQDAHDAGLVSSPQEAYANGHIRDLTAAQTKAIEAGADINKVINANQGMYTSTSELFGHRVRTTSYGTTKRSQWRKQNPSRLVRLTPESIYGIAKDDADAVRLLGVYGYLN